MILWVIVVGVVVILITCAIAYVSDVRDRRRRERPATLEGGSSHTRS